MKKILLLTLVTLLAFLGAFAQRDACTISTLPYINTFDVADPCWTVFQNNATHTWSYNAAGFYKCEYDNNYLDQDEWLISPEFDLRAYSSSNLKIKFNWAASYTWAVNPNDNYDMLLKVTTDGGTTWTTIWDETDEGVFGDFVNRLTTVDVSAYAGQYPVYFAFDYVGNNGAGWEVTDFTLEAESSPCPTISALPYINTFDVADPCWTINQTNATETWHHNGFGEYVCEYDPNGLAQDEWFISPEFDLGSYSSSNLNVKFNWVANYLTAVDPNDNYDMFLKITTDNGTSWTTIWDETDEGVFASWNDMLTSIDVSAYAGQSSVRFAFNYVGTNGGAWQVYDFTLEVGSACPTITALPYINTFDVADPCWTINQTNATETWQYDALGEYYCTFDPNTLAQDEWLLSPKFDLSAYSSNNLNVKFNWKASYMWAVDPYDNYDMFLKVTTNGGTTWTTIWDETVEGVFEWEYILSTVDVSAYAGQSSVQFALNYVGTDGHWWYVSSFELESSPCPTISTLPYINTFDVADPCWTIQQTNATETWQHNGAGQYSCNFDANLQAQQEAFISPVFDLSAYSSSNLNLKFNWIASYAWSVDPHDNYNMGLMVSTDYGANWTLLWDETSEGVFENFVNRLTTVDVSAYAGQASVIFAFIYIGTNGDAWAIDDFTVEVASPCPTISTLPYINKFDVADPCWTINQTNVTETWNYDDVQSAYSCLYDDNLLDQDEWLLSPEFDLSSYSSNNLNVMFNWKASYEYAVSPDDNYDMFLKITTDNGLTWTSIWDETVEGVFGGGYILSTVDVTAYAGQSSVQFAFNYVGNDGNAWIVTDFILVVNSPCDVITTLPYINTFDIFDHCWTTNQNNATTTWNYDAGEAAYYCDYDDNLLDQDEWLLSPEFDLSSYSSNSLSVMFNWKADYEWSVSPNDNYDMFLKVTTDGGTTWTTIWDETEADNFGAFNFRFSTIDVSAYAGQSSVQFAFNYVGNDGSAWFVSDFTLQVPTPCNVITTLPYINTFDVADHCWTIIENNVNANWNYDASYTAYYCGNDIYLLDQDEWFLSPEFDLSAYSTNNLNVIFNWFADYEWSVSPNDNYDMFLKVTTDGGTTWTSIWDETVAGVFVTGANILTSIDVSAYAGKSSVQFAFNYVGNDGSIWIVDDFTLQVASAVAIENSNVVSVYPNPSNGLVNIAVTENSIVSVVDIAGRIISVYNVNANQEVSFTQSAGMYVIRVESKGKVSTHKLVIQ